MTENEIRKAFHGVDAWAIRASFVLATMAALLCASTNYGEYKSPLIGVVFFLASVSFMSAAAAFSTFLYSGMMGISLSEFDEFVSRRVLQWSGWFAASFVASAISGYLVGIAIL